MAQKYRKRALAVLAAAALTTVVPPTAGAAGTDNGRGAAHVAKLLGPRRGRPRKFSRPSRSVTLTLPEDVIAALLTVDSDLGRAVVRAVQPLVPGTPRPAAELMPYGGGAVISVTPASVLEERVGVELVPLTDGRALIAFDERMTVEQLELRVRDVLADPNLEASDRAVLDALADILQDTRQQNGMVLRQRGIIVLHFGESAGQRV